MKVVGWAVDNVPMLGKWVEEDDETFTVEDPVMLLPQMLTVLNPYVERIKVMKSKVVFTFEISSELLNKYNELRNQIRSARAGLILEGKVPPAPKMH